MYVHYLLLFGHPRTINYIIRLIKGEQKFRYNKNKNLMLYISPKIARIIFKE